MKKPTITNTVKKNAIWNAGAMLGLYLAFSIFTLLILNLNLIDDLDSRLIHELEHISNTLKVIDDSVHVLNEEELNETDFKFLTDNPFFLQVYDLEGKLFLRSKNLENYHDVLAGFPNDFSPYYFESFYIKDVQLRSIYKKLLNQNNIQIGYIQLSTIHSSFNKVVKNVFWFNIISLPIVIFAIIFLSIFLARKSFYPINNIIQLSNKITATNLSERLEYEAMPDDELGRLKTTLNSLFDRLENQIKEISQFTDNASHQLMTPLTAMKTELDFILKREHPIEEYKETSSILKTQTDRMIAMIKTMLIMSRECDVCANTNNVFQVSNLLKKEIAKIYNTPNIKFTIEDNIYLRGDSDYLSIVIQNLINNAVKYSPNNSLIEVVGKIVDGQFSLSVVDNGIGIEDEEKKKIFQRFYRVDKNEVNQVNGYGLGLSLVDSVIKSMSGKIEVKDNNPKGTIFTITLPTLTLQ